MWLRRYSLLSQINFSDTLSNLPDPLVRMTLKEPGHFGENQEFPRKRQGIWRAAWEADTQA